VYNIPQFTGSRIEIETMKTIVENIPQVEGIKDSSGDIRFFNEVADTFAGKLRIYQGQDDLLLQSLSAGAVGGVCGSTNINPLVTEVYKNFAKGDYETASKIQITFNRFFRMMNEYPFPVMVYTAFYKKHNIKGKLPLPITTMSKVVESKINDILNFMTHYDE